MPTLAQGSHAGHCGPQQCPVLMTLSECATPALPCRWLHSAEPPAAARPRRVLLLVTIPQQPARTPLLLWKCLSPTWQAMSWRGRMQQPWGRRWWMSSTPSCTKPTTGTQCVSKSGVQAVKPCQHNVKRVRTPTTRVQWYQLCPGCIATPAGLLEWGNCAAGVPGTHAAPSDDGSGIFGRPCQQ